MAKGENAMQTPGCTCFLMLFLIAPGYAVPLEDAAPLIDGIHGLLGDDQGLVEARCGRTSFGRALAYAIVKTAEQTDGVQYCFTLQAAYPSFVLNTQGFFDEAGTTGLRDAAFFEEAVGEGLVSGDGRGWRRDPYDPSYVRGTSWRERSKRERLLKRARFPVPKGFADYDWTHIRVPDELGREAIKSCSFVGERQNLVLYGGVGNGKTHMATACGIAACNRGLATMPRSASSTESIQSA